MSEDVRASVKAFINNDGRILILRKARNHDSPNSGRFDVTGGRIDSGESHRDALLRAISKETGLEVTVGRAFSIASWRQSSDGMTFPTTGTFLECFSDTRTVRLSESHDLYEWINPKEYIKYDLVENLANAFDDYLGLKNMWDMIIPYTLR